MITIYYCYEILCIAQVYKKNWSVTSNPWYTQVYLEQKLHTMSSTHKNGSVDPGCTRWYTHNQLCLQGVSPILYLSCPFNSHSRALSFCILHLHFASYILHFAFCILHIAYLHFTFASCILHLASCILHEHFAWALALSLALALALALAVVATFAFCICICICICIKYTEKWIKNLLCTMWYNHNHLCL